MVLFQILPRHPASTLPQRYHAGQDILVGNQVERHASGIILKFANIFNGTGVLRRTMSAAPRGPLRHHTAREIGSAEDRLERSWPLPRCSEFTWPTMRLTIFRGEYRSMRGVGDAGGGRPMRSSRASRIRHRTARSTLSESEQLRDCGYLVRRVNVNAFSMFGRATPAGMNTKPVPTFRLK